MLYIDILFFLNNCVFSDKRSFDIAGFMSNAIFLLYHINFRNKLKPIHLFEKYFNINVWVVFFCCSFDTIHLLVYVICGSEKMQELFNAPYQVFTTALLFVFSLAVIEVLLFFFGTSAVSIFDDADVDLDVDADIDLNIAPDVVDVFDFNADHIATPASFFNMGKVPFFVILMVLGISFGLFGILLNKFALSMGVNLSAFISVPLSIAFSSVSTWGITNLISKILPGEENYAIEEGSFIAREAIVEDGEGTSDLGVMVSFVDEHGIKHRLLGTVALNGITVKAGDKVVLLNKNKEKGGFFILPSFEAKAQLRASLEQVVVSKENFKSMSMTK